MSAATHTEGSRAEALPGTGGGLYEVGARPAAGTLEAIADAVLYEGYLLYPYRASALKNRQRWPLGVLHPRGFCEAAGEGDAWAMQSEVLVRGETRLDVKVRFLHLGVRAGEGAWDWQEGMPREVEARGLDMDELVERARGIAFSFDAIDEEVEGVRRRWEKLDGVVELSAERAEADVVRVRARIENHTHFGPVVHTAGLDHRSSVREAALRRAFASAHTIFRASSGELVSLLDPPEHLRAAVAACQNIGTWPVLAGGGASASPSTGRAMLSSPIILYDHPQIAAESPGDLFDASEIDEILTLRILTLTDDEKREAMATDPRARAILERTEKLDRAALERLHGAVRYLQAPGTARTAGGVLLQAGSRVRLAPRAGGDIFDLALAGRAATVASIEQDFEGRVHVAVTVDDDPGRDLGAQGMPGHRFFFRPEEVEPL